MAKELFVASGSDRVSSYLIDIIRYLGRRTQKPLWGKKLSADAILRDVLYLDPGGTYYDMAQLVKAQNSLYREYVVFKNGREIHILSEYICDFEHRNHNAAVEAIAKRCEAIDSQSQCLTFALVGSGAIAGLAEYRKLCRKVKVAVNRGMCVECSHTAILRREWVDRADVFVTDCFTSDAVLALTVENDESTVIHMGGETGNIFAPISAERMNSFVTMEKTYDEMLKAVYLWLRVSEALTAAKLLLRAAGLGGTPEQITERLKQPLRKRKVRKNEGDN